VVESTSHVSGERPAPEGPNSLYAIALDQAMSIKPGVWRRGCRRISPAPLDAVEFHLNPKIGQQVMLKRQRAGFRYRARMTSGTWPVHWIMGLIDCVGFGDKWAQRPADYDRQQGRPSGDRLMGSTRAESVPTTRLPRRESIERRRGLPRQCHPPPSLLGSMDEIMESMREYVSIRRRAGKHASNAAG